MPSITYLMLRSAHQARLEARTVSLQRSALSMQITDTTRGDQPLCRITPAEEMRRLQMCLERGAAVVDFIKHHGGRPIGCHIHVELPAARLVRYRIPTIFQ